MGEPDPKEYPLSWRLSEIEKLIPFHFEVMKKIEAALKDVAGKENQLFNWKEYFGRILAELGVEQIQLRNVIERNVPKKKDCVSHIKLKRLIREAFDEFEEDCGSSLLKVCEQIAQGAGIKEDIFEDVHEKISKEVAEWLAKIREKDE